MKLTFDTFGNEKQKEVCRHWIDPAVTDIVYGGSKGSGKSYLGCNLIFGDALTYPGTHYFIARDSLTNIRKFTIPSIHEVFGHWELPQSYYSYNGQDNYYTMYNGSRVYLLDAKYLPSDPLFMRFGSMQMTRGWIEEAGEFTEDAKNNLAISIGRWKNTDYGLVGKLLQTCNPSKNYLYRNYYKPHKEGNLEHYKKFVQALPTDNTKLPDGYLENLHRVLSINEKQRLLFGNWEYDDDPAALMDYESICNLFTNTHVQGGKKYITADIARFGKDKTVIFVWNGWKVIDYIVLDLSSIPDSVNAINTLRNKWGVVLSHILCDEDGVGGGVVDVLKCKGFVNNSRAKPNPQSVGVEPYGTGNKLLLDLAENFENLKTQCYYKMSEDVNKGLIDLSFISNPLIKAAIIEEMEQVKQKDMDKEGKKRMVPKDVVRDLLGRSPDYSDTIAMRKYFDLFREFAPPQSTLPNTRIPWIDPAFDLLK